MWVTRAIKKLAKYMLHPVMKEVTELLVWAEDIRDITTKDDSDDSEMGELEEENDDRPDDGRLDEEPDDFKLGEDIIGK